MKDRRLTPVDRIAREVERSVLALVTALYVLAWLATVGAPDSIEHVEQDNDAFAPLRGSVGSC